MAIAILLAAAMFCFGAVIGMRTKTLLFVWCE